MNWLGRLLVVPLGFMRPRLLRRDVRDGLVLFAIALLAYALASVYDLPGKIFQFAMDYADWEIDDLFFVALVLSVAGTIYAFRRYGDSTREMTARSNAELEARKLARHDPLTGLSNRRFFAEKLDDCLCNVSNDQWAAVLVLDIDGFKSVIDLHGHAVADKTLIEFSERTSSALRTDAILSRTEGDAFAIIMPKIESLDDPANLARRIVTVIAQPFLIDNVQLELGVGIGIAVAPNDGTDPKELLRRADRALYRAKGEGRSSIRFFEPEMDAHVERRIQIERELRSAIASHGIVPYYQPLVRLEDSRIIGFEALARWKSEILGTVPPEIFIPLAEEMGLIGVLGDQLFRQACTDAHEWPSHLILAFNVSAIQLREAAFSSRILAILQRTGFEPHRLEVEITESVLVENIDVARVVIDNLRRAGVRIALDDFGTGYATLTQLLSFHLDKIKIDKSFVSHLVDDHDSLVIVRAILGLAKGFGLTSLAEGIENTSQLACLRKNGCTEGQGYLFGEAIPAAGVLALLARTSDASTAA
jgi:diguanylate cyclase (GGDEF)-like protein